MQLSYEVLKAAAALCARWTARGWKAHVSVNMPPEVLLAPDATARITEVVERAGVRPQDVVLELTEDDLYDSSAPIMAALARLRLAGFGLALDDVGRRQSGLMQLSHLPVTEIKIDIELIRQAREWAKSQCIISSLTTLGHQLGLTVVAEGIETEVDLQRARRKGVDYIQGFLISRKRTPEAMMAMLERLPHASAPLMETDCAMV